MIYLMHISRRRSQDILYVGLIPTLQSYLPLEIVCFGGITLSSSVVAQA